MQPPTSLSLTRADLDLLDWLIHYSDQPNRTAMVHTALVALARQAGAPAPLIQAARHEREDRGERVRVRPGTAALRSTVLPDDTSLSS